MLQFFASLGLALLLNLDLKLRWLARTLALVPWAMPPVIVAIMWRLMLNPTSGPVNEMLARARLRRRDQLARRHLHRACRRSSSSACGRGCRRRRSRCSPACSPCPTSCTRRRRSTAPATLAPLPHVTLPSLRPIIVAITTLDLISNFNSFALVYVLTAGGPGGKTMLPSLFVYNEAFRYGNWGYAAAMGNVMVVVVVGDRS